MANDPLSELKDIHWPDPPGIWPLAAGYYLVLLLLILLGLALVYFLLWGFRKYQLKKAINQELRQIEAQFYLDQNVGQVQARVSALLKRLVFYQDKEQNRALDLSAMAINIKKILPGPKTDELLKLLETDRYKKDPQTDGQLLLNLAREQIKRCRI